MSIQSSSEGDSENQVPEFKPIKSAVTTSRTFEFNAMDPSIVLEGVFIM